ncbi:MAG: T9SS type A sorting domain-containing protein, partial [Saprospiraceae bacterium]|nr:T9SS type A sorting domain-containing protein [Saprospiraceae bacterium]
GLQLFFCAPPVTDAAVSMCCEVARPGFDQIIHISMYNRGTLPIDTAFVTAYIDPKTPVQYMSPPPFSFDPLTNQAVWRVRNIPLNGSFHGHISAKVQAPLGDTVHQQVVVTVTEPDVEPNNNISTCERIVTGSFDPNDKLVNPIGAGAEGGISSTDTLLTYLIRFQNTGNDTAFTVVVRDTLDALVYDLNSVQPLMSSHPFRLDVEGSNILVFSFDPIHLPDSNRNEAASHGYVLFQVKTLPGLPAGTVIRNSAAIYFDYNDPVITADAVNTIVKTTEHQAITSVFSVFPNPSDGRTNILIRLQQSAQMLSLELFGPDGRYLTTLYRANGSSFSDLFLPVDLGRRPPGIYFVRLQTERGVEVRRVVVY